MMMIFSELTREQAEQFRDHVVAREPYRLGLLAERMAATGGPIDAMDASVASLVPAWQWFMRFFDEGFPGVPLRLVPSRAPHLAGADLSAQEEHQRRWLLSAEALGHYVTLVVRRVDPAARWEVYVQPPRAREYAHHETMLRTSGGLFFDTLTYVPVITSHYRQKNPTYASSPERLRDTTVRRWPELGDLVQDPAPSALAPYLELAETELPPEVAVSPVTRWANEKERPTSGGPAQAVRVPSEAFGGELTLAAGPEAGLTDLTLLRPLPVATVAEVLMDLDFAHADGTPLSPGDLLTSGTQVHAADATMVIETAVADGALRALYLEPAGGGTAERWNHLETRLRDLATRLGAHLAADQVEDWPEP